MLKIVFSLFFILISFSSHAETYKWYYTGVPSKLYDSPDAACPQSGSWGSGGTFVHDYAFINLPYAPYQAICYIKVTYNNGGSMTSSNGMVNRLGDSCPSGSTYEENTGQCKGAENKCAILKDTAVPGFRWKSASDMPPATISVNGCAANVTKARCAYLASGTAECTGTATLTGEKLESSPVGSTSECTSDDCKPSLAPEKKNEECVYVSLGNGVSGCTATNSESNPGNSDCGTVNGEYKCIRNPKATSVENKLDSKKTEKSNTDGTVTTVKDNTLTTKKCVDQSCTTSTTNSKGTTTTDANGNKTGETSTCTGANCNGKGETNGTGDDNKAGDDDGKDDEGDEEEGTDTPPVTPIKAPEKGNLDGEADAWDTKIADSKTELKDSLAKVKDSFSPVGDVSLGGGGGGLYCPPPVAVLGGTFDICMDKYADKLSWIGSAIYAAFAIIALFIIFI